MTHNQDGFALRTEVALRARYPHLVTRLFEDQPGSYLIAFDSNLADAASLTDVFEKKIRPATLPIAISNEIPSKFVRELDTLTYRNVGDDLLGFSFKYHDLRHLLASRFPSYPVLADPLPGDRFPTLRFDRAPTAEEAVEVQRFLNGMYPGWPIEIADVPNPAPPEPPREVPARYRRTSVPTAPDRTPIRAR